MMNERAQLIKAAMAQELKKEGKTLADLELAISKTSSTMWNPAELWDVGKNLANGSGAAALTLGALGATTMYGAYRANETSNDLQMKKLKEKQQYLDATKSLQEDMQNPLTL